MGVERSVTESNYIPDGGNAIAADLPATASPKEQLLKKVAEAETAAAQALDTRRCAAADLLDRAAEALQQRAADVGAARQAAYKMQDAAVYLRAHDTAAMGRDLRALMSRHPVGFLAGSAVGGYLLGRALRGAFRR